MKPGISALSIVTQRRSKACRGKCKKVEVSVAGCFVGTGCNVLVGDADGVGKTLAVGDAVGLGKIAAVAPGVGVSVSEAVAVGVRGVILFTGNVGAVMEVEHPPSKINTIRSRK
jgi:hypothetical protein